MSGSPPTPRGTPSRWRRLEPLARVGYATKGAVYLIVGGLALLAASGEGGKVTGSEGAVKTLGQQPFGQLLLLAAAGGLVAYAGWRLVQAILDLQPKDGALGAFVRAGFVVSALMHGALALLAFQMARGQSAGRGGPRDLVATALGAPFGRVVVALAAAILLGAAIVQLVKAATTQLDDTLEIGRDASPWLVWSGRAGLAARGVVFAIVALGLGRAALFGRASEARDTGGALRELAARPHGDLVLGVVAAGLAAYGVFMLASAVVARFRSR
jgi:hypothetical protein